MGCKSKIKIKKKKNTAVHVKSIKFFRESPFLYSRNWIRIPAGGCETILLSCFRLHTLIGSHRWRLERGGNSVTLTEVSHVSSFSCHNEILSYMQSPGSDKRACNKVRACEFEFCWLARVHLLRVINLGAPRVHLLRVINLGAPRVHRDLN